MKKQTKTDNENVSKAIYLIWEEGYNKCLAEVEKMIDDLYLKEECNCEWFLQELKQKLQEMKK